MARTEKLVITFKNTTGAIAMERRCKENGIPGRLIPVPRSISASCGLCWVCGSDPGEEQAVKDFIRDQQLETESEYRVELL